MPVPHTFSSGVNTSLTSELNANFTYFETGTTSYTLVASSVLGTSLGDDVAWVNSSAFSVSDPGDYVAVIKLDCVGNESATSAGTEVVVLSFNAVDLVYSGLHRMDRFPATSNLITVIPFSLYGAMFWPKPAISWSSTNNSFLQVTGSVTGSSATPSLTLTGFTINSRTGVFIQAGSTVEIYKETLGNALTITA